MQPPVARVAQLLRWIEQLEQLSNVARVGRIAQWVEQPEQLEQWLYIYGHDRPYGAIVLL